MSSHRDQIFGPPASKYLWCLHGSRTYDNGKWRTIRGLRRSPYLDCDGDAVLDTLKRSGVVVFSGSPEYGNTVHQNTRLSRHHRQLDQSRVGLALVVAGPYHE